MKHLILLLTTALIINKISAQIREVPIFNGEIKLISVVPEAKLLYNTDKGKVYALPQDNMKCLAPDMAFIQKEEKNYKQFFPPNTIPNAYPKLQIIPIKIDLNKISIFKNTPQISK